MKAYLKYDDPLDAERALAADRLCSVIFELQSWLRSEYKWNDNEYAHTVQEKLSHIMIDNNIDLDYLYP